ncbi:MAG: phosphopantetheine-binding protein [Bacteroidota bacterium]
MDQITKQPVISREEIFSLLRTFIIEVIGDEFIEASEIQLESSFTRDLDMDSIEIVAFSEKVKNHFGEKIDFTGWLSDMDLDQIIELNLLEIVKFIESCLS